jgi:electron transport complex protein RnfG
VREILRLVIVLTIICVICSFSLAIVKKGTEERIEYQKLKLIKEPAIKAVLPEYDNDPILEKVKITLGPQKEITVFPAKKEGKLVAIAYETVDDGYGGPIEVMLAIKIDGTISGVKVMKSSETPGIGKKIETEPSFVSQFKKLSVKDKFILGEDVEGISGATISSTGVTKAVGEAVKLFDQIIKNQAQLEG